MATMTTAVAFHHPLHGEVSVEHDPRSGEMSVVFERLEIEGDIIMPNYCLRLTASHAAEWVRRMLTTLYGRRCHEPPQWTEEEGLGPKKKGQRLQALLRETERDAGLAYCMASGQHVVLIRGGRVLKVALSRLLDASTTLDEFARSLLKEDGKRQGGGQPDTAATLAFVDFVHELML